LVQAGQKAAAPRPAAVPEVPRRRARVGDDLTHSEGPAGSYLSALRPSGRRSMRARLDLAAGLMLPGSDADTFPWETLSFDLVDRVRRRLSFEGKSDSTINLVLAAVRQTARRARLQRLISPETLEAICSVPGVRTESLPRGRMLQAEEKEELFRVCAAGGGARGRRDACLLALLGGAGLRREEAAALRLADCDLAGRRVRVRGKGGREGIVPLEHDVAQAVTDWVRARGRWPGPLLVPVSHGGRVLQGRGLTGQAVYLIVLRLASSAGLEHLTPHDLRRTFISDLWDSADASTVKELARHRSVSTSTRYDRRGERAKAAAIEEVYVPYVRPPARRVTPAPFKPRPRRRPRKGKKGRGGRPRMGMLEARSRGELVALATAHRCEFEEKATRAELARLIREAVGVN
jgi:integrase